MKKTIKIVTCAILVIVAGCGRYLDVVPDNIATIESAFTSRTTAEKFLFTCYAYMPQHGEPGSAGFMLGDEFWLPYPQMPQYYENVVFEGVAMGNQSVIDPILNYWDGTHGGKPLFRGIRDCNIFLENIGTVPGMQDSEKRRWIAEVKFLKAYYHFWLVRMYGPIPVIRENLPISSGVADVKIKREPIDSCFAYIDGLLASAAVDLPLTITSESTELGRISKVAALGIRAYVAVNAASPLFNGNNDYAGFLNVDGKPFFDTETRQEKWQHAAQLCKEAVDAAHEAGHELYRYRPVLGTFNLTAPTITQMSIRNSVAERWNPEVLWGNPNSLADGIQRLAQARIDPARVINQGPRSLLAPPLKMAELFYTKNGVPINEDKTWNYAGRFDLVVAGDADSINLQKGYQTVRLHFDRENRFYANMAFDGGTWYGQGRYDDRNPFVVQAKAGQTASRSLQSLYSVTGYWPKKLVHFQNIILEGSGQSYSVVRYPWPVMRLADLYLLYAEALNELAGPSDDVYPWVDLVRERAGLNAVDESWMQFARNSAKHTSKDGLRDIIRRERLIELAFEGHRFWDLCRWKLARETFNNENIQGWDINQSEAHLYYRVRTIHTKKFNNRDYFWPIAEENLIVNSNLVQNPGW